MAAFLAHYRALAAASAAGETRALSSDERATLHAMDTLTQALTPQERAALGLNGGNRNLTRREELRRRERAELKLRRILLEKGILRS